MFYRLFISLTLLSLTSLVFAADYPHMEGIWKGNVRIIESGIAQGVSSGGMNITETELIVTIEYQVEESFIGKSRSTSTPSSEASTRVWGSIRSNGKEAIFLTGNGGRGQIWFENDTRFEFCVTSESADAVTAYCAVLNKVAS
ncbi:MAG: hypothetical protein ACJAVI_006285 [Candidatus Azotimanducaceae bacterium]|jgi:hypothetical protein